ncbi:hypothetical protein [Aestuariivirga sp.]|uniref:hypothetical protein n=1 Tax=Aestuariivirga sp. TaxID=2650926 RepID=UPI0039E26AE5
MKRADLQKLAEQKIEDASLLLANNRFGNAFYLAGYAIEIGLKACISKQIIAQMIPSKQFVDKLYTHEFKALIGLAGLAQELQDEQKRDRLFATYWGAVGEWNEAARYTATDAATAQLMVQATRDTNSGVLRWIRLHW